MKKSPRAFLTIRVLAKDKDRFKVAADKRGLTLTTWVMQALQDRELEESINSVNHLRGGGEK